jgi:signal transduction histidine kinase
MDAERVARAEHELRGATTALRLICEVVRRDPAAHAHAVAIDAQLDRLRAGLADLQVAQRGESRLHAAEEPPARARAGESDAAERVELSALARAAAEPWENASFEWEGPPLTAEVDRRRFAKALGNVLANAAEHGEGDIRVTGRAHNGGVRLEVRNRGRGLTIASEAAEELGGSLSFELVGDTAIATIDLPTADPPRADVGAA